MKRSDAWLFLGSFLLGGALWWTVMEVGGPGDGPAMVEARDQFASSRATNSSSAEVRARLVSELTAMRSQSRLPWRDKSLSPQEWREINLADQAAELEEIENGAALLREQARAFGQVIGLDDLLVRSMLSGKEDPDFRAMLVAFYRRDPTAAQEWLRTHPAALDQFESDYELVMASMSFEELIEVCKPSNGGISEDLTGIFVELAALKIELPEFQQISKGMNWRDWQRADQLEYFLALKVHSDLHQTAQWLLNEADEDLKRMFLLSESKNGESIFESGGTSIYFTNPLLVDELTRLIAHSDYEEASVESKFVAYFRNNPIDFDAMIPFASGPGPKVDYRMLLAEGQMTLKQVEAEFRSNHPERSEEDLTNWILSDYMAVVPEQALDFALEKRFAISKKNFRPEGLDQISLSQMMEVEGVLFLLGDMPNVRGYWKSWERIAPEAADASRQSLPAGHPWKKEVKP